MSSRLLFLALLVLAPPAFAQLSEQQAVAQVKASSKEQLVGFKSLGKAALASLDADLKVIEAGLDETTTVSTFSSDVTTAVLEFLDTLNDAWDTALLGVALDTAGALTQLADGGQLEGVYPESLYAGAGGVLDAHRKAQGKAAAKLRDAAVKRLAKCAAKAEKQAGLAFTVRLELPALAVVRSANQGELVTLQQGVSIDLLTAVSALDTPDDGRLVVAGRCSSLDEVTVTWFRTNLEEGSTAAQPSPSGRFSASFSGLKEGACVASATRTISVFESVGEIGVR